MTMREHHVHEVAISQLENAPERAIAQVANRTRNWNKHWSPGEIKVCEFDAPEEAKDMLNRAVDNYYDLTGTLTPAMQRFQEMHTQKNAHIRRNLGDRSGLRD